MVTSIGSERTQTEVAQLDAGHFHGSRVWEMPSYSSARNVRAIPFTWPGGSTTRSADACTDGSSNFGEVQLNELDWWPDRRPGRDNLTLGDGVGRPRNRGFEQRGEVDAVEGSPPFYR